MFVNSSQFESLINFVLCTIVDMLSTENSRLVDFWITEYARHYMLSCLDVYGFEGMNEVTAVVHGKLSNSVYAGLAQ